MVSLRGEADSPEQQVTQLNQRLQACAPFDLVILGMGNDAHTASLFPDAPQLQAGLDPAASDACLLVDPPVAPHQRISMTLARLLNAEQILVHITGEEGQRVADRMVCQFAGAHHWRCAASAEHPGLRIQRCSGAA